MDYLEEIIIEKWVRLGSDHERTENLVGKSLKPQE